MTELKVRTRDVLGKKTKVLRREGIVPAEVYGHGVENLHVSVPLKEFVALYRTAGSHTVISLAAESGTIPAMIAEVSRDPLTDEILAVDFHAIKKGEKVRAKVPVVFVGTAPAVKEGFVVVEVIREIEIEALPEDLIHKIEASVEKLMKPGDSLAVKDLSIPSTLKLHVPADAVLATVREHVKEAVAPAPAPAEATAEGAPVEGEAAAPAEAPAEPEKK
jgi:large subunit ribosomal protein L25